MTAAILVIVLVKLAIVLAMVVAAGTDVSRRIIPNETVLVVAAGGLLLRFLAPDEPSLWPSIAAALAVLVLLGLMASHGFLGGGDVKMISAASLAVPLHDVLLLILNIALAGGAVATFYLARSLLVARVPANAVEGGSAAGRGVEFTASIPYGVSVLLGVASLHLTKVIQCSADISCWL